MLRKTREKDKETSLHLKMISYEHKSVILFYSHTPLMHITLTQKQYEIVIRSLELATNIYGLMNDSFEDEYCKEQYASVEETQTALLSHHKDF